MRTSTGISGDEQHAIKAGVHDSRNDLSKNSGVAPHQAEAVFARFLSDTGADDNHIRTAAVVGFARLKARRLGAHARDKLGISEITNARPVQAALASAATFTVGAALPLTVVLISPQSKLAWTVSLSSLIFLSVLGAVAASVGGSGVFKSVARVTFWGALAMLLTAVVGSLFGVAP